MLQRLSTTINYDRCLQLFLLFAPILWLPGITQNSLQFLVLNYGGIILLSLALFFGNKREIKNSVIPVVIIILTLLSVSINPKGFPLGFIAMGAGIALYYSILTGTVKIRKIVSILLILGVINVIFSLFQRFGVYTVYDVEAFRQQNIVFSDYQMSMPGLMGRNYHLSYFLIFISPLGFIINKKIGWLSIIIASVFAFLVKSYACRLSLLVMLGVLLSGRFNWKVLIILVVISLGVIFYFKGDRIVQKFKVRSESYEYTLKEILVNVFQGHGIGSFDADNHSRDEIKFGSSFNQYLRFLYEIGVVPCLLIFAVILSYFKQFKRKNVYFLASLAAILTYPIFHEVLIFARFNILIITVVALFEVSCIDMQTKLQEEYNE